MADNQKKIVFVYNTASYLYNFRLSLMKAMKARGWEVIAVSPYDDCAKKIDAEGIRFWELPFKRKAKNPLSDLWMCSRLAKFYHREKPDFVHHFTIKPVIYGTMAARISGVSGIVNHISGLGYIFLRGGFIQYLVEKMYRFTLSLRVQVIFQNLDDLNYFLKRKLVVEEQTHLIRGSGVNTEFFSPDRFPVNNPSSETTFVLVARMLWDKGIAEFVEAAKIVKRENPKARFLLIGSPDEGNPASIPVSWLEEQQKGNLVEWIKQTEDVRPFLARSAAVVLPSYREGAPRSLIEAAAMAKPIITTDVPGCREIVKDRINGYLVPVKNVASLARVMLKLAGDPARQKQMSLASRERTLRYFDERVVISKTLEVYNRI